MMRWINLAAGFGRPPLSHLFRLRIISQRD